MNLKLAHLSDLHLDDRKDLAMQQQVLLAVVKDIEASEPDCILLTGDLYERKSSPAERLAASTILRELSSLAPVVLVKGNHDAQEDLSIFTRLESEWGVAVFEGPAGIIPESSRVITTHVALKPGKESLALGILVLPWMDKAHFQAVLPASMSSEQAKQEAQAAAQTCLDCLENEAHRLRQQGIIPILAAHLNVLGAEVASGQVPQGTTIDVTPDQLGALSCAYVGLGHIHKHQDWYSGRVCYSGSPIRHDFGEPEEKGWVLVHISGVTKEMTSTQFMHSPCPEMHRLELDLREAGNTEAATAFIPELDQRDGITLTGSITRVRLLMEETQPVHEWCDLVEGYLESAGCRTWKVEPVIEHRQQVRDSRIANARTTWEKVTAWMGWSSDTPMDAEQEGRMQVKLGTIEELTTGGTIQNARPLTLDWLHFRGFTTFLHEVHLNLKELGAGLIALVGRNGAGKTTIMETVLGGLFRSFATRSGSLYDHAHGTDAFIEQHWSDDRGQGLHAILRVNAEKRQMDGVLSRDNGSGSAEVIASGAATCREKVEQHWGTLQQVRSSVFMAQDKGGSFLAMPRAQRRQLFIDMLGLSHLSELCEAAKAQVSQQQLELQSVQARLGTLSGQEADLVEWEHGLPDVMRANDDATALEAAQKDSLGHAEAHLTDLQGQLEASAELRGKVSTAREKVTGAERASRAAIQHREDTKALWQTKVNQIDPDQCDAQKKVVSESAAKTASQWREMAVEAQELVDKKAELMVAKGQWDDVSLQIQAAEKKLRDAKACLKELVSVEHELERAQAGAALVKMAQAAPCKVSDTWHIPGSEVDYGLAGGCELLSTALQDPAAPRVERLASTRREHLKLLGSICPDTHPDQVEDKLTDLVSSLVEHREQFRAATVELEQVPRSEQWLAELGRKLAELEEQTTAKLGSWDKQKQELQSQLDKAKREMLSALETEDHQVRQAAEELAAAQQELEGLEEMASSFDMVQAKDVEAAQAAVATAKAAHEEAAHDLQATASDLATFKQKVGELVPVRQQIEQAKKEETHLEAERGDWLLLSRALGKHGVQALEIDAAGPETSGLVNQLLDACFPEGRFRVTIQTLKEKKSSPGEFSEDFDLVVHDQGQARPVDSLSGGEKVIISEAVSLALSIFNARRSGVKWGNIFRDETASALDPENASHYVAMLRKAMELGGFHQCIFVAHLPQVYEAADTRLMVGGGQVQVQ